jgi:hypothetical protein
MIEAFEGIENPNPVPFRYWEFALGIPGEKNADDVASAVVIREGFCHGLVPTALSVAPVDGEFGPSLVTTALTRHNANIFDPASLLGSEREVRF